MVIISNKRGSKNSILLLVFIGIVLLSLLVASQENESSSQQDNSAPAFVVDSQETLPTGVNQTTDDTLEIRLQVDQLTKLQKKLWKVKRGEINKTIIHVKEGTKKKIENKIRKGRTYYSRDAKLVFAELYDDEIEELTSDPDVIKIWPDLQTQTFLNQSTVQINAPTLWNLNLSGSQVKIAVLDTGIDAVHEMLAGRVVVQEDFTGTSDPSDHNNHGTHVAGISAGNGNYRGVAYNATLYNGKVLSDEGYGQLSWLINGIDWAIQNHIDVISLSLGAIYSGEPEEYLSSPEVLKVEEAVANGITVVIASGNCGSRRCGDFTSVTTPGIARNAITVGAVDRDNTWAEFSSGDTIADYIKPDVVAPGVGICSSVPSGYACYSGTSMATPHISGAVALLLQYNHSLQPLQIKQMLEHSALDLGVAGKDVQYGSGLIDLSKVLGVVSNETHYEPPEQDYELLADVFAGREGSITLRYINRNSTRPLFRRVEFSLHDLDDVVSYAHGEAIPFNKSKEYSLAWTPQVMGKYPLHIRITERDGTVAYDLDNDGTNEKYMLVGSEFRVGYRCKTQTGPPGYRVKGFDNGGSTQYGCFAPGCDAGRDTCDTLSTSYCDDSWADTSMRKAIKNSPTQLTYYPIFCDANCSISVAFASEDILDPNANNDYVYILNCAKDSECADDKYCNLHYDSPTSNACETPVCSPACESWEYQVIGNHKCSCQFNTSATCSPANSQLSSYYFCDSQNLVQEIGTLVSINNTPVVSITERDIVEADVKLYVKDYLKECQADSLGYCNVPVTFSNPWNAILVVNSIEVSYDIINIDMKDALQSYALYNCTLGSCSVPLKFTNNVGIVNLTNLSVYYSQNDPPSILNRTNITAIEGGKVVVQFSDLNEDALNITTTDTRFVLNGNQFEWQTNSSDVGTYLVNFTVSDGLLTDKVTLTIIVSEKEMYDWSFEYASGSGATASYTYDYVLSDKPQGKTSSYTYDYEIG